MGFLNPETTQPAVIGVTFCDFLGVLSLGRARNPNPGSGRQNLVTVRGQGSACPHVADTGGGRRRQDGGRPPRPLSSRGKVCAAQESSVLRGDRPPALASGTPTWVTAPSHPSPRACSLGLGRPGCWGPAVPPRDRTVHTACPRARGTARRVRLGRVYTAAGPSGTPAAICFVESRPVANATGLSKRSAYGEPGIVPAAPQSGRRARHRLMAQPGSLTPSPEPPAAELVTYRKPGTGARQDAARGWAD